MFKTQIVLDFGYTEIGQFPSSITELADCAIRNYKTNNGNILTLAQSATYEELRRRTSAMENCMCIAAGQSGTAGVSGGGTYHVLQEAERLLMQISKNQTGEYLPHPYQMDLVAHSAHVMRAREQGWLFGFDLRPIENLPTRFYACAAQWWCRGPKLWRLRETLGYWPLKLMGQI